MAPGTARGPRLASGSASIQVHLDPHIFDVIAGCRADLEWLAGDRYRGHPLVRLEAVRMADP